MKVPFVDLKAQYNSIKSDIDGAIAEVIDNTAFIKGKYVDEFETNYKKEYGAGHCLGVANGTDALYIALKCLGIKQGDEVITTAYSWISTSETISQTGAKPVFIDIDPDFYTIDVNKIEEKITGKTKAIVPVHFYGQMADIVKIKKIADKHSLLLIEDCAQSHFAEFNGIRAGLTGNVATFSFYPGKNLGAYGDAGAIITNDENLALKMRMFANHGSIKKHNHQIEGINSRLDGLQAAILSAKLPYIHEWNSKRIDNARIYQRFLSEIPEIITPSTQDGAKHIFHVYCVRAERRSELMKYLSENGIDTAIHYPTALPNMPAYQYLGYKPEDFPVSTSYQDVILSLPMFPELTAEQIEYVALKIKDFYF